MHACQSKSGVIQCESLERLMIYAPKGYLKLFCFKKVDYQSKSKLFSLIYKVTCFFLTT